VFDGGGGGGVCLHICNLIKQNFFINN
jgi:hypothetical protein